jgi:surface polysaccharide O-acyltransferase-like enzyme
VTLALAEGSVPRAARLGHVHAWDWLRIAAMLDVAGLHLRGEHLFGGIGLPLFHMLSVALSVSGERPPDSARFAAARARRFLLPWLFWSAVFSGVRALAEQLAGRAAWGWCEPRMLLYGPIIALWFLPFTVLASMAAHLAQRALDGRRCEPALLALLFCAGVLIAPLALRLPLGWPFEQWLFSVPSVLLGFVIGRCCALLRERERVAAQLALGSLTLVAAALVLWPFEPDAAHHLSRFVLAFSLISAALWLPDRKWALGAAARPLLLGVYILHPVLYQHVLDAAVWKLGLGRAGWARIAAGVGASALCVWLLRRTPLRRFV